MKRKPRQEKPVIQYTLKELKETLKEKQKRFCHTWIRRYNKTQSYKEAYGDHLDDNVACNGATRLLRKSKVQQYINYIKDDIAKEVGISKIGLLNILKGHAEAKMGDLLDGWVERKSIVELKKNDPTTYAAMQIVDTKTVQLVKDHEMYDVEYVKIKMYDSQKAIDMIFKAMDWYASEKVTIEAEVTNKLDITQYTDDEKQILVKLARKTQHGV